MEDKQNGFVSCEYCDNEATTKKKVYDADMDCTIEKDVCSECADYLEDEQKRGDII